MTYIFSDPIHSHHLPSQDLASEKLRSARARARAVQAKASNILKGYGGEVSERGGRLCVVLPAGACAPLVGCSPLPRVPG